MKFRHRQRNRIEHGRLDMTPLIDVVFLLLIFFMLTSTFVTPPGIKVKLPKAVTSQALGKDPLTVTLTRRNEIFLESKQVNREGLEKALLAAGRKSQSLLIKADREVSFDEVVSVWDLCRSVGVTEVSIATNP